MDITALWAKKSQDGPHWLPLWAHMTDTAEIAKLLWDEWLPDSVKRGIANSIGSHEEEGKKLFSFLALAHDMGKATPVFQATCSFPKTDLDYGIFDNLSACGLLVRERRDAYQDHALTPHAIASQLLLEQAVELGLSDSNLCINAAVILGSHHGKPPETGYRTLLYAYASNLGIDSDFWRRAQAELIRCLLDYSGYSSLAEIPSPSMPGQVLLSGLVIIADWIASSKLPLISFDYMVEVDARERARTGWLKINLPGAWSPFFTRCDEGLYRERFGSDFEPNLMQEASIYAANDTLYPGIMIIEAPMGSGKTEAALAAAEVFRNQTESGGLFFALPTQATSDGIFPRLLEWIHNLALPEAQSVRLAHGKAQFNEDYMDLFFSGDENCTNFSGGEDLSALAFQWFNGRKKALLANFVVGTIDQLLLMALKQKHVMLRHVGLAGKVVIIDECHAYDAYMNHYLKTALAWLHTYKVPVIVLSATLPIDKRRELVNAYLGKDAAEGEWAQTQAYPLITYSDGKNVRSKAIEPRSASRSIVYRQLAFDDIAGKLQDLLSEGGCAGIVMNTVQRAQAMARLLRKHFKEDCVVLIHSRFITTDRMDIERNLRKWLGKNGTRPEKLVVVGTQVLEQSLDIDFDVMVIDIAPMDLLLQRLGREHRHDRLRKKKLRQPMCFITGIESDGYAQGIDRVYDVHLLNRTKELLASHGDTITLPGDIAKLVNAAYDKNAPQTPEKENWETKTQIQVGKAGSFLMRKPTRRQDRTILSWLVADVDDKRGEATVRDTYDAVDVLVIKETPLGFSMMNGTKLPSSEPDNDLARQIACQSLSLPRELSNMDVIETLRKSTNDHVSAWQSSPWLSGELFLILDDSNSATLCGHKVVYSPLDGLYIDREG